MYETFKDGMRDYSMPREAGEENLVNAVQGILEENGLGDLCAKYFMTDAKIKHVVDKNSRVQRTAINRFFDLQLLMYPKETLKARLALINNGEIIDWKRYFVADVVPVLVRLKLPNELHI